MSYWTFSDVFEEQGVVKTPFYGGFGLLAERSIPKPAFNDFALCIDSATRGSTGRRIPFWSLAAKTARLAVAVWNLFFPKKQARRNR